jgi:hypothetical protein
MTKCAENPDRVLKKLMSEGSSEEVDVFVFRRERRALALRKSGAIKLGFSPGLFPIEPPRTICTSDIDRLSRLTNTLPTMGLNP